MAGSSNYSYDKSNPFFEDVEDEVDDATFLGNRARPNDVSTLQERREQLLMEKRKIEERTVQSTFRSISLLRDSEQIGTATAEELVRQREQLENTEVKLDAINSSLRTSQKHIQSIKSVFGSIKNYFAGGKPDDRPRSTSSETDKPTVTKSRSELSQILENHGDGGNFSSDPTDHPTMRFRSESIPTSRDVDKILDQNLEEMGSAISRLKNLGLGLQGELDSQSDLLDRVANKTDNAVFNMDKQNKEMNRILKK
jgi:synaptosomal-associated protein 29